MSDFGKAFNGHKRWTEEQVNNYFYQQPWHDRANYLAWVAEWKAELKRSIALIRENKALMQQPGGDSEAQSKRAVYRVRCCNLQLVRQEGKIRSNAERQRRMEQAMAEESARERGC